MTTRHALLSGWQAMSPERRDGKPQRAVPPQPPDAPAPQNLRPFGILAVGAAIAVIGLSWWQWHGPIGRVIPEGELKALGQIPSGEGELLESGRQLVMISSYHHGDGRFCREYETHLGAEMRMSIACHGPQGWGEEIAVDLHARGELLEPVNGGLETLEAYRLEARMSNRLAPEAEARAMAEAARLP